MSRSVKEPKKSARTSLVATEKIQPKLSRHCIATVIVNNPQVLLDSQSFSDTVHKIVKEEGAQCVGEVSHEFYNHSFTSIFALAESHISVHTWPERFAVQLDVFLCNYMHDNTDKCERIFEALIDYFDPVEVDRTYVERL